ncbi:MAG TPA: GNAT family N-acetyltransferase [Pyrinomonadaceae bacterium]|nr:GNAT family N-acetyltransferase [Pyrinomonadaceae bacterium]
MTVSYRRATERDIAESAEIFLESVVDMYARKGIKSPPPERSVVLMNYGHVFRTGIFYVAEVDGALATICHAVVRDRLWFLSGFWARPGLQGKSIGGKLLRIVMDEGAQLGAETFFTWSSVDLTAMATYMKTGMLPGYQILTFAGKPVEAAGKSEASLEVVPLSTAVASAIDKTVRETGREEDHRFWLMEAGCEGREVVREGRTLGYFYFNKGTIGPAAWLETEDAESLLEAALPEASRETGEVRLMIPGVNHAGLRFALSRGLRLTGFSHLLTSAPFGRMQQYLSSGPSLF